MARIGVLSPSDGRDYVQSDVAAHLARAEARLCDRLRQAGHEVVVGASPLGDSPTATAVARQMAARGVDLTIFHYAVWAFPHFTMLAADATRTPLVLLSNIDPAQPGMVGMLAAGGALDQTGRRHLRLWGELDEQVLGSIDAEASAARALRRLHGSTFGRIGGRPMGMNTAVASTSEWMRLFGVDVEEIDQWEIVRRSEAVPANRAAAARSWLEKHAAGVHYDGAALTPDKLERQIRAYFAMRELIDEWHLDFSGIKGQPELTTHFATMDVTEAFLNDPYDFEGPKAPHVCATEADMDGALTMQIMHLLTGTPVLFADVRHYHEDRDVWDLCNSGQHATWYAARSDDPAENLARTHLYPEVFFFPAGGASVHHLAAPGEMTLARLSRERGHYRMQLTSGRFETYDEATNEQMMRASTYEWPHAFARLDVSADAFLGRFGANHIHAVPGDIRPELRRLCDQAGIVVDELAEPARGDAGPQRPS